VGAVLAFIVPVWQAIKPYWKYLVGAVVLIALVWFIHSWYEGKLDAAYARGVDVTQAEDAAIIAERERLNAQVVSDLKVSAAAKQAELEGKLHANELVADDLRTQLRAHRVCSDERSGRTVSGDPGPASESHGTAGDVGPPKPVEEDVVTVGDDLVTIGEACQSNTDKLISLQSYMTDLMAKLKRLAKKPSP
jgi:hypothetical protein